MGSKEQVGTIVPINGRVAVERAEVKYEGRLIIPDSAKEIATFGKAIALSQDAPEGVEVGDTVIFHKHGGTEFEIDGRRVLLLKGEDILAVYEK